MLVPLWGQRIKRLTIDFLKHPIHVLKVVMIQEPHIRIFFVLVKRNYKKTHRSDHCLLKGVKKLRKKQKSLVFFGKFPLNPILHYAFSSWIEKTVTKTINGHWENRFVLQ